MPRTDTGSRLIHAPLATVYAALIDPDALKAWLPPAGMTGRIDAFDPRPGGVYRMVLTYLDGGTGKSTPDADVVDAHFVEIVPNERMSLAVGFVSDDPSVAGTMTMTWEIADVGGATRVDITASDVPDGISAADHATGLASSLANLARYVERPGPEAGPVRR